MSKWVIIGWCKIDGLNLNVEIWIVLLRYIHNSEDIIATNVIFFR